MSGPTRTWMGGSVLALAALLGIAILGADAPEATTPLLEDRAVALSSAAAGPVCQAQDAEARAAAFHATFERLRQQVAAERSADPEAAGRQDRIVVLNGRGYNYDSPDRVFNPAILELEAKLSR